MPSSVKVKLVVIAVRNLVKARELVVAIANAIFRDQGVFGRIVVEAQQRVAKGTVRILHQLIRHVDFEAIDHAGIGSELRLPQRAEE